MWLTAVYVKWVQVYLNTTFKVQGGTADGDNLSLSVGKGILLSLGWSIWLQVYADSIWLGESWVRRLIRSLQEPALLQRDPQTPVEKERWSFWTRHDKRRRWTHQSHWRAGFSERCWSLNKRPKRKREVAGARMCFFTLRKHTGS